MFEHRKQPLAARSTFFLRIASAIFLSLVIITVSLVIGMWGYHYFETGMTWVDAFANASMILSGMGPLGNLQHNSAKIFAGVYALYSGLALITITGVTLAPIVHRFLHHMHADIDDADSTE